jgi:hypothetical protein
MGVSTPYALDAIDAAAKALCDARGRYATARHQDGLTGSAFLWDVADAHGTDQRYVDEREDLRNEVVIVALSLAASMAAGIGGKRD